MDINMSTQFLKMQNEALDFLTNLIVYDREQAEKNGEKAENTLALKAFIDTQRKALNMANLLLEKHKESLLEIEKQAKEEERKKREEENAKRKAEQKKLAVKKDLKKAKADENSLFADMGEPVETEIIELDKFKEDTETGNDGYDFEEYDTEGEDE